MKIAIFKKIYFIGGGEVYTKNLINDLQQENIETVLVTNNRNLSKTLNIKNTIIIKSLKEAQRRKEIIIFMLFWPIDLLKYFLILLNLKKKNFDIIILQDLNEKILITPLAKLLKIKTIWVEHTTWEPYLVNHPLFFLINFSAKKANKIIAPSQFLFDQTINYCPDSKVIKINTGVVQKKLIKEKKDSRHLSFYIVSRLSDEKGLDVLIKAIPLISDNKVTFNIIGDGVAKNELIDLSKKLNIKNRINFCGGSQDPYSIIEKDSILVLPSRQENFSLVLLEALSVGMPVIASRVGGNEEIITEGKNGFLFENENYNNLADKINYILENPSILKTIKKNNLERYKNFFTQDIMIKKIINLLESL